VPDRTLRPRSGSSAKALLLTVLGELVLARGGQVWTRTVVRSLGVLGVGEKNARQAMSRLADRGLVSSRRIGRQARWHLTEAGRDLLTAGAERIYRFGESGDAWDDRWLVVLCSVPEDQRAKRHQLRSRLAFAGFGFLAPGVAVSPHLDREPGANAVLVDLDLQAQAVVLRAELGDLVASEQIVHRAWDLDDLASSYLAFLDDFGRLDPHGDDGAFEALVHLVHAWRRFPFVDPELPEQLLPGDWPGHRAKQFFEHRRHRWTPGALRFFVDSEGEVP
jgi:phenylacetic acid degradation operon negative regulatory protein